MAVCDTNIERAKLCGKEYGVSYFKNLEKMLDSQEIDILSICTPSGLHPQHGKRASIP